MILVALSGFFGYRVLAKNSKKPEPPDKVAALANCLSAKQVKMYGAFWCAHCQKQKEAFGPAWQYVNYVECSNPDGSLTAECQKAGVEDLPTWDFANGLRLSGELTFEKLAQTAQCRY